MFHINAKNINIKILLKEYWGGIVVLGLSLIALIYFAVGDGDFYAPLTDNLNGGVAFYKYLRDTNTFFDYSSIARICGGISRNCLPEELKVYTWAYFIFPDAFAWSFNWVLGVNFAAFGFVQFFRSLNIGDMIEKNMNFIFLTGALYGAVPVHSGMVLSFAFIPMAVSFYVNYAKKKEFKYLLGIFAAPFFIDLVYLGVFLLGYSICYLFFNMIMRKKTLYLFLPPLVYTIGTVIAEHNFFSIIISGNLGRIHSSIVDETPVHLDIKGWWQLFVTSLLSNEYNANSMIAYFVLPVCIIFALFILISILSSANKKELWNSQILWRIFFVIGLLIIFNAIAKATTNGALFYYFIQHCIPSLSTFNFTRINWLSIFMWYVLLCIVILYVRKKPVKIFLFSCAFAVIAFIPAYYNMITLNLRYLVRDSFRERNFSYKEFFSEDLFVKIKSDLNYNDEYSLSCMLPVSVLIYNGISSLEGYVMSAPYESTELKIDIFSPMLQSGDISMRSINDGGGTLVSKEVLHDDYPFNKHMECDRLSINIDRNAFIEHEGKYIFSRVLIENAADNGFRLRGVYSDDSSPYTIYVYELN